MALLERRSLVRKTSGDDKSTESNGFPAGRPVVLPVLPLGTRPDGHNRTSHTADFFIADSDFSVRLRGVVTYGTKHAVIKIVHQNGLTQASVKGPTDRQLAVQFDTDNSTDGFILKIVSVEVAFAVAKTGQASVFIIVDTNSNAELDGRGAADAELFIEFDVDVLRVDRGAAALVVVIPPTGSNTQSVRSD